MKTTLNTFLNESDKDPFYSHNLRMQKGYKPKYKLGLIAVRFQDDEKGFGAKYKDVNDDGEFKVNYQDLFSHIASYKGKNVEPKSDFVTYFMKKYELEFSNYRNGTDDFFIYFKCKPGTEKETIKKISKDKIVKVVDYVDVRGLENGEEIEEIGNELVGLGQEFSENSDEEIRKVITNAIERLQKLL